MATVRRQDQKTRIRQHAARLFAANGYDATGIQEISNAVGLGRGALYHHIGSKEQLLFDIITLTVMEVVAEAEAVRDESVGPEEKVRLLSRMMMKTVAGHLAEWRVFFREVEALQGPMREEAIAWRDRFEDVWTSVIQDGVDAGVFRDIDPVVIKGILGMHNYAHVWLRPSGRLAPDEIADKLCDVLLSGLRVDARAA